MPIVAAATAFSLICTGTMVSKVDAEVVDPKPSTATYQIDLEANRWCVDGCTATFPVNATSEMLLTLDRSFTKDSAHLVELNRRNGSYLSIIIGEYGVIETTGKCVRGIFKGFTVNEF